MSKNGFNYEQNLALDNPLNVDLLISAGAGSGKTKTLSEKVMKLIEEGLKPSELLVLTFTNNAAHEMKSRIIAKFIDNKEIAYQLASAHIQTFDSFSQYLVSTYSGRLHIAEQISIMNEDIINTKKNEFVDAVFDEYYRDSAKNKRLLSTLIKFNLRDDEISKNVVLDIVNQLEKLSVKEQDKFLNHYEQYFLSKEYFDFCVSEIVRIAKGLIEETIFNAYFAEKHYDIIEEINVNELDKLFKKKDNFKIDIKHLQFEDEEKAQPLYEKLLELLNLDGYSFIDMVRNFTNDYADLLPRLNAGKTPEFKKLSQAYSILRLLVATKESSLAFIQRLGDANYEYSKIVYFKDDISLYLEMVKEIRQRLLDYKKTTNSFTFADISNMALSLMINPEYEDIAEEIRCQFKFIMVDEYQDTNDLQEAFIESLLKANKKGERSHLFCVGDAKQSIYAFRGSNVQLFRDRQKLYLSKKDANAIPMNKNYRSGKKLLDDINHIFNFYMTANHGSIAYQQVSESLQYDNDINLYNQPYDDFGIHRITSISSINNDNAPYGPKVWEARAIAADIKKKLNSGFKVSRRTSKGNVVDRCRESDFCILVGKKSCVDLYQKVFQEFGLHLNCSIKNKLNEVDAVTVIQSLIGIMEYILDDKTTDPECAHLFASVARSYLFEYDDQTLFNILYQPNKQYVLLDNDPIMMKIYAFVDSHKDSPFSKTFIDLINDFEIMAKLYKVGAVDDVINKIESLYQLALTQEKSGEGIREFVSLMNNVKKYDLDLNSESLYEVEDAVSLMTIHASKGLEKKIVYMPCSFNSINKGDNRDKPDYIFSKKYGILLPYYNYQYVDSPLEDANKGFSVLTIGQALYAEEDEKDKIGADEHVRLFYVALTRAENALYIVGDLSDFSSNNIEKQRKNDTLYGMLSYAPYYISYDEDFIKDKINKGIVKQDVYQLYLKYVSYMKDIKKAISSDELEENEYRYYSNLWQKYYLSKIYEKLSELSTIIEYELFAYYFNIFKNIKDENEIAKIFALYYFHDGSVKNKNDLLNRHSIEEDEDSDEDVSRLEINSDNLDELLVKFKYSVDNGDNLSFLNIKDTKRLRDSMFIDDFPGVPVGISKQFLDVFNGYFDAHKRVRSISFECKNYEDKTYQFDYLKYPQLKNSLVAPTLKPLKVDNQKIEFSEKIHKKASKTGAKDEELPAQEILDFGTRLHRLLELVDLKIKDTSFITNQGDKRLIDKVLRLPIFDNLNNAKIYQEYGYYDVELLSNGFIDLLIQKDEDFYIIDYKAKHTKDDAYVEQVNTYKRNIKRIFNISDESKIHMYLLSIIDCNLIQVD